MKPVLLLDNYDSFTFNLAHLLESLSCQFEVVRNDKIELKGLNERYHAVLLSPGPGIPSEAGQMPQLVKQCGAVMPILGICLGHQCIGEVFGSKLENMKVPMHGKTSSLTILEKGDYLFKGLPDNVAVGRYHSWLVAKEDLPTCLQVTAVDEVGNIMALSHSEFDLKGLQFHPESVMTAAGATIIGNWVEHLSGRA